jgi:hypothetical protein
MQAIICPYCSAFMVPELTAGATLANGDTAHVAACLQCKGILALTCRAGNVLSWAPQATPRTVDLDGLPEGIAADFHEGQLALGYGLNKAAVMLFRRSVQAACLGHGAPTNKRLGDQIDWLEEHRLITPAMRDTAHEVRYFGNEGAHPDDDGLDALTSEETNLAFECTRGLFQFLYDLPARTKQAQERREAQRQAQAASRQAP